MAKKGQTFQKYTVEMREEIIKRYLNGDGTSYSLANEYGISRNTVKTWISAYRKGIPIGHSKRGRTIESEIDYKERYEILKKFQAFVEAQREKK